MRTDLFVKLNKYQLAGVQEYWIVSPKSKTIIVHTFTKGAVNEYTLEDTLASAEVEVVSVGSRSFAGQPLKDIYRNYENVTDALCETADMNELVEKSDVIFMALPHGIASKQVTAAEKFFKFNARGEKPIFSEGTDIRCQTLNVLLFNVTMHHLRVI